MLNGIKKALYFMRKNIIIFAATKNGVAKKVLKGLLYVMLIVSLATSCSPKECYDTNNPECENYDPRIAQLAAKRTEIHTFYRDSLGVNDLYDAEFNGLLPAKPIFKDTTDIAEAVDPLIQANGSTGIRRRSTAFKNMCSEYVKLESQAKK